MLTFVPNLQISTFRHTFFFRVLSFPSFAFLFLFFLLLGIYLASFWWEKFLETSVKSRDREIIFERSTFRKLHKLFNGPF